MANNVMTGVKPNGFVPVFHFHEIQNQFQKLKNGDYQMKFIRKQASSVIVRAGTLIYTGPFLWIGQGEPTMTGDFRFV